MKAVGSAQSGSPETSSWSRGPTGRTGGNGGGRSGGGGGGKGGEAAGPGMVGAGIVTGDSIPDIAQAAERDLILAPGGDGGYDFSEGMKDALRDS